MPRAENRKRPPNLSGNTWQNGSRHQSDTPGDIANSQAAQSKKQDLIEKMKKLQQDRKSGQ